MIKIAAGYFSAIRFGCRDSGEKRAIKISCFLLWSNKKQPQRSGGYFFGHSFRLPRQRRETGYQDQLFFIVEQ